MALVALSKDRTSCASTTICRRATMSPRDPTTSLWLDGVEPSGSDPLPERVDDLVVGAGLTGLTTGLLLARAGRRVAVVEARYVGAVTTGNTTAKLSLLQGTRYSMILRHQSEEVARAYVDANREGQEWLLRFCEEHAVPYQRRDAVTYAASPDELSKVQDEHQAASSLGLEVEWFNTRDVPFPVFGATLLPDQAQFDPMDVLTGLVSQLRVHGATLHEGLRLMDVSFRGTPHARLSDGSEIVADDVILTTGTPMLDRGLYFAKVEPSRSYALAFDHPSVPIGMYLSVGSSSRSVRDAPGQDGSTRLVIGGSGHTVGRTRSTLAHVDELREWTARYFPGAVETHRWSAQDYTPHDGIPYVGKLPRGGGRIYLATGFAKWGMTNGVAAARNISSEILGERASWAKTMSRRITRPSGAARIALFNAGVGVELTRNLIAAETHEVDEDPLEGQGVVGRDGLTPTAVSTVDGVTCAVQGLCTHLGGALSWNDAERTWDCPLHGSRFAPDGSVLEGPATKPLSRRDVTSAAER
jgi:glycine/D-amino acid oxidase-like deaminating enzyme/nitrite reductase/ring-hydroxylating ferredoxin subunit